MAKRTRTKPKAPITAVTDLDGVNAALAALAEARRHIDRITAEMNDTISQAKSTAEVQSEPWQRKIRSVEAGLAAFAEMNKDDLFIEPRHQETNNGKVGFRRSSVLRTMPGFTWKKVLEILRDRGDDEAIRVKESVNKEVLASRTSGELAEIGVERHVKDDFYYELDERELVDTAAA